MLTQACSSCNGNLTVLPSGTDARPPETYQARRPISGFRGLEDYGSSMVVPRHGGSHKHHGPRTSRLDLGLLRVSDLGFKVYIELRISRAWASGFRVKEALGGVQEETCQADSMKRHDRTAKHSGFWGLWAFLGFGTAAWGLRCLGEWDLCFRRSLRTA